MMLTGASFLSLTNLSKMSSVSSTMFTFCQDVLHSELPVLLKSVSVDLKDVSARCYLSKNKPVKLDRIHVRQNQLSQEFDKSLYSFTDMFMHLMCCQKKQSSHWVARWLFLTGLQHSSYGCLIRPGFCAISPHIIIITVKTHW